jgi:ribonuclease III
MNPPLAHLEQRLSYRFRDRALLEEALTHRSFAKDRNDAVPHNERLEFLGDAILGFAASARLMRQFPRHSEGRLTKIKAQIVSAENLYRVAREIPLGPFLRLGKTEERNNGREKKGLLVNAFEALVAAVYLDGGLEAASAVLDGFVLLPARLKTVDRDLHLGNAKSALQELVQGRGLPLPSYRVLRTDGPSHSRVFQVELDVAGLFKAEADGPTKRAAEQRAAASALASADQWLPAESQVTQSYAQP